MNEYLPIAGVLAVIAILVIANILLLANLRIYFFKPAQGTTAFIKAGEKLKAILPNVGGYKMSEAQDLDNRHWLIPVKATGEEEKEKEQTEAFFYKSLRGTKWFQKWLWRTFAVKFISLVWPHTVVHCFDIRTRERLQERNKMDPKAPLRSRIVPSPEGTSVDSLLFIVPRPVYVEGVELAGDNSRINLLLLPIFHQVIPSLPVFYLKGDFFTLLDAAIEAAVVDFFSSHRVAVDKGTGQFAYDTYDPPEDAAEKTAYEEKYERSPLTYSHWLKLTKAGERSPLEQRLHTLNVSQGYFNKLKAAADRERVGNISSKDELLGYITQLTHGKVAEIEGGETAKEMPSGMIPRFGFALVSIRSVEWEAHGSTEDLAKALLAKETKFHEAEGVRKEADGVSYAIQKRAEGESSRYDRLVTALVAKRVTPDVAAGVVQTQLRTENIGGKDSKIVTYVEGGASASVMVPAGSPPASTK